DFQNTLIVTNGAYLEFTDAVLGGTTPLLLSGDSQIQSSGSLTSTAPVKVEGGMLVVEHMVVPQLMLTNGAVLTSQTSTTNQMHKLEVEISGMLIVSTNSRIDVSGKGYLGGYTSGNTTNGASLGKSGGSYGGLGVGQVNAVYGDYADPEDWGSGSGA